MDKFDLLLAYGLVFAAMLLAVVGLHEQSVCTALIALFFQREADRG
jgi:hypothetical protein